MAMEMATIMVAMTMVLIAKNADGDESSVGDPHGDGDDVTALLVMVITILTVTVGKIQRLVQIQVSRGESKVSR